MKNKEKTSQETQETEENAVELILDYSVVDERGAHSYTSLTDLYQLSVFTESFNHKMRRYQDEKIKQDHDLQQKVFVTGMNQETSNDAGLVNQMFMEEAVQVQREEFMSPDRGNSFMVYFMGGMLGILFFLIFIQYQSLKRRERSINAYNVDNHRSKKG